MTTLTHSTPEVDGTALTPLPVPVLIKEAISYLEDKFSPPVGTYVEHNLQMFQKMPQYNWAVHGKIITFHVDADATHTIIKRGEFPTSPKICGNHAHSIGASGNVVREHFTVPLRCIGDAGKFFKHAFLLSDCCPVNLLGRDQMCRLGIGLISTPEGVKVTKADNFEPYSHTFVKYSPDQLLFAYKWKLTAGGMSDLFLDEARKCTSPLHTHYMQHDSLLCTSHISLCPDSLYEKQWHKDELKHERLTITQMFWSEHKCVASARLTPVQEKMFAIYNSSPHISLSKHANGKWEDLGPFTHATRVKKLQTGSRPRKHQCFTVHG